MERPATLAMSGPAAGPPASVIIGKAHGEFLASAHQVAPVDPHRHVHQGTTNASVSPSEAKVPDGLKYSFTTPVSVSVTEMVYSTLDRAP